MRIPRRKWIGLAAYGVGVYLLLLIVQFPAQLAWRIAPPALVQPLQIQSLEGSVWSGKANGLNLAGTALDELRWRLHPLPLFLGRLSLDGRLKGEPGQLTSRFSLTSDQELSAENLKGVIHAQALNPYTVPLTLRGAINLDIRSLRIQAKQRLQLSGELLWQNAAVDMVQSVALGEVRIQAKAENNGTRLKISNKNSPLAIDGIITVNASGHYNADMGLSNREPQRTDIDAILQTVGRPDANGRVSIRQRGQLPFRVPGW